MWGLLRSAHSDGEMRRRMRVSVIVPVLNEESCIEKTLHAVQALNPWELIVADGGSTDRTVELASGIARVVHAPRGRGAQQRAAAMHASGDVLWFLHADTVPGAGALDAICSCLLDEHVAGGNFSLRFDGGQRSAEQLTRIYPWLRLLGLCYGDSGIFVRRSVYLAAGEFQPYPLFEDVDLVRRIKKQGKFRTLPETLVTSSRRFEHRNFALMFAEWTALQVLFWAGVSPYRLAEMYRPIRTREVKDHG
jgi:rSAM/selenodomain-associated transferase 2